MSKIIKILGSGCPSCIKLEKHTQIAVKELNLEASIEKITDFEQIMSYNVMSTPALVIDEKFISYGKVLSPKQIKELLA